MIARSVVLVCTAYLLGAVPFGYLLAGAVRGVDIRTLGSGNIGATNVGRVLGRGWGLSVFVLDVLKGYLAAHIGKLLGGQPLAAAAGLAAIVGHNWPVYLKFRGGKGVATSCGVFLAVFPMGLLISFGVWVAAVAVWRYVSVGSMLAGIGLLISAFALPDDPLGKGKFLTALAGLVAVMSIVRHRSNIHRLLQGTENKVGGRKRGRRQT